MGTIGSFYLNGPNLVTSTGIFTDPAFTTCAPDGWYSQEGVVRQLLNCVLLPKASCPSCANPCGSDVVDGLAGYGLYSIPVELGTSQGAVKVTFDPKLKPQGIRAIYNNAVFNEFSSEIDGYHQTTVNNGLTYMGDATYDPTLPLTISGTNEWDYYNGAFNNNGTVIDIYVTYLSTTSGQSPDECIAYIPKTLSGPSIINMEVAQVITGQATPSWNLSVGCPTFLLGLNCTTPKGAVDCTTISPLDETMYLGKVSGDVDKPVVYDWAFADNASLSKKSSGQYLVEDGSLDKWIVDVDANGIISAATLCPSVPDCTNLEIIGGTIYPAVYIIPMELGTVLGAIKVVFSPNNVPDGIRVNYNNAVYNEFSSEIDGYHQTSLTNGFTYMGNSLNIGTLESDSPHALVAEYEYSGGAFSANGDTTNVIASDASTTLTSSASPDECIAYIPRTTLNVSTLSVEVATILDEAPAESWRLQLFCPVLLNSLSCTIKDPLDPCNKAGPFENFLYLGKVSGAAFVPVVHDWAFADENALNKFVAGTYGVIANSGTSKWTIIVDSNGIITSVTLCP
jgi:hypothetical protein